MAAAVHQVGVLSAAAACLGAELAHQVRKPGELAPAANATAAVEHQVGALVPVVPPRSRVEPRARVVERAGAGARPR
ncbi:MAG TPA: hypothetical protein VHW23_30980 [Kofleriaceae bacterium]|jgi:hypothetical protein|nr:hypothetical protein [Kofleriaceae bacterium]